MKESVIKTCITPSFVLETHMDDGTTKALRLCYDYRSIAAIEDATGLDLKKIESWQSISSGKQFPQVIHGGLRRYHPDVTLDELLDMLNPQAQQMLSNAIFDLMFPGVIEAITKQKEQGASEAPNVQTPTSTD